MAFEKKHKGGFEGMDMAEGKGRAIFRVRESMEFEVK